jgi:hypothetical protein
MKRCECCGAAFEVVKSWSRFCSDSCRMAYHKRLKETGRTLDDLTEDELSKVKQFVKQMRGEI